MSSSKRTRGVLVRLTAKESGIFLNLDDVEELRSPPGAWQQRELITFKQVSEEQLDRMEFDEQELADFGYYILAKLHAFKSQGEAP